MFKNNRQLKILELIESEQIETQQELSSRLNSMGFKVTQATVSRDIKYLGLIKIPCGEYRQKYAQQAHGDFASSRLGKLAGGGVVEIREGHDKVFIKTNPGCGKLVKQYLTNILGEDYCIICDDNSAVIFVFGSQQALIVASKIKAILHL